ncbi:hypothetical protein Tco_0694464 [Tanacetum coccineum]
MNLDSVNDILIAGLGLECMNDASLMLYLIPLLLSCDCCDCHGFTSCQLDEQWFNLHKDILRDALDITLANDNNPFEAPPSSDTKLIAKTSCASDSLGYHSSLQIDSWAERIWEEFVFNPYNLPHTDECTTYIQEPPPLSLFTWESIINSPEVLLKDGRNLWQCPIPDALLTDEITSAPYYSRYLEYVAEYQRCLDEEHGKAEKEDVTESPKAVKANKSKIAKQTKPSAPKASKVTTPLKPTPTTTLHPQRNTKHSTQPLVLSSKEPAEHTQDQLIPVVYKEPDSGRIQPLPDVQGKGKEKRRTPTTTEPSGHAESPSLYAELGLNNSEMKSDKEVSPEINAGTQDEG